MSSGEQRSFAALVKMDTRPALPPAGAVPQPYAHAGDPAARLGAGAPFAPAALAQLAHSAAGLNEDEVHAALQLEDDMHADTHACVHTYILRIPGSVQH